MHSHDTTEQSTQEIPYGYCHCGCGQKTTIATKNNTRHGVRKGEPYRFIPGHNARKFPGDKYATSSTTLSEAFWLHVEKAEQNKCWVWTGVLTSDGYGFLRHNRRCYRPHRISYEIHLGPIPNGLYICHRCDNPRCVNPAHLFAGDQAANMRDMYSKGRASQAGTSNGNARLTATQVLEIRQKFDQGKRRFELAKEYRIGWSTVDNIVRHVTWTQI